MSDDWLRKAEEQREQKQHGAGGAEAEREAANKALYEENKGQVAALLAEVGELWKSIDPHRTLLLGTVTTHVGHDYSVHVDKYQSPRGIALYLFDKSNMNKMYDSHDGIFGFLNASLRVMTRNAHFIVTNDDGLKTAGSSLESLKAVIADLWQNNHIKASKY